MRAAPLLLFVVLFLALFVSAAEPATCPATVDIREQLTAPLAGWSPMNDDAPHQLAGLTFYDGAPQQKASLVYDNITKATGKQVAKWTFAPHQERAIWIACSYSGTSIVLTRTLPPGISSCAVTYDAHQQIAGLPVIETIACK